MKKSNRLFRYIFTAVILIVWIALAGVTVHAAQLFEMHLLDVGQGQCVLIEADGHYMLIDGGGRSSSSFVVSYLKQQGIERFDYIALSHYDEDHMSCLVSGDAEQESEWDMVNSGRDISADVYVAGHHGSRTSTTEPFLDVVSPTYHVPEKR